MKKYVLLAVVLAFGVVAIAETQAHEGLERRHHLDKRFEKMDLNGDGFITQEEFNEFRKIRFLEIDANNDGYLSKAELAERIKKWKSKHSGFKRRKIGRHLKGKAEKRFSKADKNGDRKISREEFGDMTKTRFNKADINKDGKITIAELKTHRKALKEDRP